jgi:YD repeat-containing protein
MKKLVLIFALLYLPQTQAAFCVAPSECNDGHLGASPRLACELWALVHFGTQPYFWTIYQRFGNSYGQCWANRNAWGHITVESGTQGCPVDSNMDSNGDCVCTLPKVLNETTQQCEIPPPAIDYPKTNGQQCPADDTNPINIGTGNKIEKHTDYNGVGAYPLRLQRTYNSNDSVVSTRIGQHWRHSYDKSIESIDSANVNIIRADGQVLRFILSGNSWNPDADITDQLVELVDTQNQRTGWRYTTRTDTVEEYDVVGQLISMTNRAGQVQILDYALTSIEGGDDDSNTLDKVTDPFGRSLNFSYDANGRIDTVTNPAGEIYSYSYDANGNLEIVTYPDDTPLDLNDNPTRVYHYEDTNFVHALTGITDENNNRFATWTYDTQGRAITSEHAGNAGQVTISYNADGTTTVNDSLGRIQTYHFDILFGVVKSSQIDGGPCLSCGGQTQNTTYDANGFVASRTDFNGNITNYVNDTRGLQTSRTEAAGTAEERTITTEWHVTFRLPIKITEPGKLTTFTYDAQGRLLERKEETAP